MPVKRTVIVIEDQTELGHVIRDVLGQEGYRVVPARTPAEAHGILREKRIELLVSDLPDLLKPHDDPLRDRVCGGTPAILTEWRNLPSVGSDSSEQALRRYACRAAPRLRVASKTICLIPAF